MAFAARRRSRPTARVGVVRRFISPRGTAAKLVHGASCRSGARSSEVERPHGLLDELGDVEVALAEDALGAGLAVADDDAHARAAVGGDEQDVAALDHVARGAGDEPDLVAREAADLRAALVAQPE